MAIIEILALISLVVVLLLPLLTIAVDFTVGVGVSLSLSAFLLLTVLACFVSQRPLWNLLVLASASALACAMVYILCSAAAGDLAFLLQSLLLGVVSVSLVVPPL